MLALFLSELRHGVIFFAVHTAFKVEMRSRGIARRANQTNDLSFSDGIARLNARAREVTVNSLLTVAVVKQHIVAVAAAGAALLLAPVVGTAGEHTDDRSLLGGKYRRSHYSSARDIYSPVIVRGAVLVI